MSGRVRLALGAVATVAVTVLGVGAWGYAARAGKAGDAALDPLAFEFSRVRDGQPGQPVTWDPCLPIRIVVNSEHAPPGADRLLAEAVQRVNSASGLRLEVAGPTAEPPDPERSTADLLSGRPGAARAPVLLAWTTPSQVPRLKGRVTGVAGPVTMPGNYSDQGRFVGGHVYLDGPDLAGILRRSDGHARARSVVMHELAHLVGLGHVENDRQVMAPTMHRDVTEFGVGDLAGLRRLGSGGCPYDTAG